MWLRCSCLCGVNLISFRVLSSRLWESLRIVKINPEFGDLFTERGCLVWHVYFPIAKNKYAVLACYTEIIHTQPTQKCAYSSPAFVSNVSFMPKTHAYIKLFSAKCQLAWNKNKRLTEQHSSLNIVFPPLVDLQSMSQIMEKFTW